MQTVYAGLELLLFGVSRIVVSIDFEVRSIIRTGIPDQPLIV